MARRLPRRKTPVKRQQPERGIHIAIAEWLKYQKLVAFHVPNEGRHRPQYRFLMARMGVVAGAPDFVICGPHGYLLVEVKAPKGRLSEAQSHFRDRCLALDIPYRVVYSLPEVIALCNELWRKP